MMQAISLARTPTASCARVQERERKRKGRREALTNGRAIFNWKCLHGFLPMWFLACETCPLCLQPLLFSSPVPSPSLLTFSHTCHALLMLLFVCAACCACIWLIYAPAKRLRCQKSCRKMSKIAWNKMKEVENANKKIGNVKGKLNMLPYQK